MWCHGFIVRNSSRTFNSHLWIRNHGHVCFQYVVLSWHFSCYHSASQSVSQFSRSVVSDSLQPHESQHARPPSPSPTPGLHSDSRPSSRWCHPAISSSVIPFSSCPQSLPASQSFPMSQLFAWGGQSTRVAALASFLQYILIGSMLILYYVLFYLDLTMYTRWVEHMSELLSFGDYFFF